MLYKIEEIRWNEMEKNIEEIPISMSFLSYEPIVVFKLPIFGCCETDEEHYTVKHYGDLGHAVTYMVIESSFDKEATYKYGYKSIERMFCEMQKKKLFEWTDEDGIRHKDKITHVMPISNKDFYKHGRERFYPKEMEIAVKQILVDSKKRFKEWK